MLRNQKNTQMHMNGQEKENNSVDTISRESSTETIDFETLRKQNSYGSRLNTQEDEEIIMMMMMMMKRVMMMMMTMTMMMMMMMILRMKLKRLLKEIRIKIKKPPLIQKKMNLI